jgi:hypothetical protein
VALPGEKSQFDVVADGRLLFYPDHAEILALLG